MDQRQKQDLDNYITGHHGEDQFRDDEQSNNYILQMTEKSFCPKCGKNVELLTPEWDICVEDNHAMFYICFDCRLVAEAGVGEVKRV